MPGWLRRHGTAAMCTARRPWHELSMLLGELTKTVIVVTRGEKIRLPSASGAEAVNEDR